MVHWQFLEQHNLSRSSVRLGLITSVFCPQYILPFPSLSVRIVSCASRKCSFTLSAASAAAAAAAQTGASKALPNSSQMHPLHELEAAVTKLLESDAAVKETLGLRSGMSHGLKRQKLQAEFAVHFENLSRLLEHKDHQIVLLKQEVEKLQEGARQTHSRSGGFMAAGAAVTSAQSAASAAAAAAAQTGASIVVRMHTHTHTHTHTHAHAHTRARAHTHEHKSRRPSPKLCVA